MAWAQLTPSLDVTTRTGAKRIRDRYYVSGIRPTVEGIAQHTADVAGYLGHTSALDMLRALDTKRDYVHDVKRRPIRMRVHGRVRDSEREGWETLALIPQQATQYVRRHRATKHGYGALVPAGPTECLGWHVDSGKVWHGHRLVTRTPVKRSTGRTAVVSMAHADRSKYADLGSDIASGLAEGRTTFDTPRGVLTVTKGQSGRHSCTLVVGGKVAARWQARAVGAIAARCAA
jgi:hypothetical protein